TSDHRYKEPLAMIRRFIAITATVLVTVSTLSAQHPPGQQGSANIKIATHIPMASATDIEIEQELSRPYAYVSTGSRAGFQIINLKDPYRATTLYEWRIADPELHAGGATGGVYLKAHGRYFYVESMQFQGTGPDPDLGGVVFDVTGLPDTSKIKEVARIRVP